MKPNQPSIHCGDPCWPISKSHSQVRRNSGRSSTIAMKSPAKSQNCIESLPPRSNLSKPSAAPSSHTPSPAESKSRNNNHNQTQETNVGTHNVFHHRNSLCSVSRQFTAEPESQPRHLGANVGAGMGEKPRTVAATASLWMGPRPFHSIARFRSCISAQN